MAVQLLAREGGKLVGRFLLDYLIDVLRGTCHDTYIFEQKLTGGSCGRTGFTHLRLHCQTNLSVDWFSLSGYPTDILIFFGPGSRLRDMFNSRYSEGQRINVREFIEWFKPNIERKILQEGADIELRVTISEFERTDIVDYGPPPIRTTMKYKKASWLIRIFRE